MRVLVAMFKHETNSFSPIITDEERFRQWCLIENQEIESRLLSTNTPTGGYLTFARAHSWEVVTPIAAESMPSGPMSEACYESLAGKIIAASEKADALLLDLHGAMVTETSTDAEGLLLQKLRTLYPEKPIALALDFHANISEQMVENADVITGFQTYPHIDMRETGLRAARILEAGLTKAARPTMGFGRIPVLPHTLRQGTDDEPFASIMTHCRQLKNHEDVLDISFFGGFPLSDTPYTSPSVIVITNNNQPLAHQLTAEILKEAWQKRQQMVYQGCDLMSTLKQARKEKSTQVLLDHSDNCGSGGTQDVMTAIKAIHDLALEKVAVWDPGSVKRMQQAGIGETITLELGGKTDIPSLNLKGAPLTLTGRVKSLFDGKLIIHGDMYHGVEVDLGHSAVLDTGSMEIIIVSHHVEPWDKGVFIAAGINPEQKHLLVLKSRIHHRASFNTITRNHKLLDGEGCTSSDYRLFPFQHLRRPIYPLDEGCGYPESYN